MIQIPAGGPSTHTHTFDFMPRNHIPDILLDTLQVLQRALVLLPINEHHSLVQPQLTGLERALDLLLNDVPHTTHS